MKKTGGYLKLCNNPFKEKAEKLEKKAIRISVFIAILIATILLIISFII